MAKRRPTAEPVSRPGSDPNRDTGSAVEVRERAVPYDIVPASPTLVPDDDTAPAVAIPQAPRKRPPPRTVGTRVHGQPAFVLHSYPYKETSLIVELLTRDFGRVALIAKGAKRPHSQLRGVLQTFQPLSAGWTGKNELRTLTDADWVGGMLPLEKTALLCGFYLNELLVKLLARDDAHPKLFDHYVATLNQLAHQESPPIVLRKFETALLKETGVAADLTRCTSTRAKVLAEVQYVVEPERGPRPVQPDDTAPRVAGKTLLDMEREDYRDAATQAQSKQLMRFLLAYHLNGAPLNTRQILIDLMQL
ncbi:DNA repair protein RecO [Pseudoduganella armeniaca]|uniref:DNA repair protein RecO n=1 Tax=Pseudoduganella armeniaca TaxID=2072590 RepID=UPI001E2A5991|nr:DNA repair protein RecO [Pseudoduganella armeniaca]